MRFARFPAYSGARTVSLIRRLAVGVMLAPVVVGAQQGRVLIRGVPFHGWRETGQTEYANKAETNPSIPAAQRMIAGYWRSEAQTGTARDEAWKSLELSAKSVAGAPMDSLMALVRAGVPVFVEMTLTPVAHPLSPMLAALAASKKVSLPNAAATSGLLGTMVPVAEMERWSAQLGTDPARDRRMMAARVVVGFDEARGVIVMHDPSFGPAWELPRAQFEAAWRSAGAHMTYVLPNDAAAVASRFAKAPPYRTRTVDERAAEKYAFAYANAAVGEFVTAERVAREAITSMEASDGYRHVLNLELGLMLKAQNKVPEAIRALEDALKWVNDSPVAWQALAQLYRKPGAADSRLADYAAKTGADLAKDTGTLQRLAAALPSDLVFVPLLDLRGWCDN